jgi:hypothetical protein
MLDINREPQARVSMPEPTEYAYLLSQQAQTLLRFGSGRRSDRSVLVSYTPEGLRANGPSFGGNNRFQNIYTEFKWSLHNDNKP